MKQFNACSCCEGIRLGVEGQTVNGVGIGCIDLAANPFNIQSWTAWDGYDYFFDAERNYGVVGTWGYFGEQYKVFTNYNWTQAQYFAEWVARGGRLLIFGDYGGVIPEGKKIPYSFRLAGPFRGVKQSDLELNNSFLGSIGSSMSFREGMFGFSTLTGGKYFPTLCMVAGNYPITQNCDFINNVCCCQVNGGITLFTDSESGVPIGAIEKIGNGYVMALGSPLTFTNQIVTGTPESFFCPLWENWYLSDGDDLLQFDNQR